MINSDPTGYEKRKLQEEIDRLKEQEIALRKLLAESEAKVAGLEEGISVARDAIARLQKLF